MRTLRIAPILLAVLVTGCVARAGAPVSFPGATSPADVDDRSAEAGPAIAAAARPVDSSPAGDADRRVPAPPSAANRSRAPEEPAPAHGVHRRGDLRLTRHLDRLLDASGVGPAIWGMDVRALDRNERLYARNPDVLLTPASTMKLVTLAATAERLGWDDRFETTLLTAAPIRDGTLQGDLVVRGAGDPTINASRTQNVFAGWADELRSLGVRRIAGRIIGDDDVLDDGALETPGCGSGWAWDDFARGFAAPAGALQHRGNVVDVVVEPGSAAGRPARARFRQPGSDLILRNEVITVRADRTAGIRLRRLPGRPSLVVAGRIPEGSSPIVRTAAVGNPTLFFVQAFKNTLERHGIAVDGEAVDVDSLAARERAPALPGLRALVRHRSEPLSAIGADMLKQSRNLYAESLVRHLGVASGSTARAGRSVVGAVLNDWGIDARGAVVADGSGLSRYTYLSAGTLVEVLARLYEDPDHRAPIMAALPVAGRDGTLRERLVGTAAEGIARAKTGSMSRVRALAGYVESAGGEPLAFAVLANNFSAPAAEVTRVIDEAVAVLASFSRDPARLVADQRRSSGSTRPASAKPRARSRQLSQRRHGTPAGIGS
ncbi:MAG: D-alanyl-D-alanine carboxypeptidase/D-alanyl-D-alanine-endopeptidase [Acidobacteria bacterium]|nr:D-alanyl-D-alanine carboxypeptidase/D-alanyl-D-alanine-endopeptidase [Acidobacteriota bacterium]